MPHFLKKDGSTPTNKSIGDFTKTGKKDEKAKLKEYVHTDFFHFFEEHLEPEGNRCYFKSPSTINPELVRRYGSKKMVEGMTARDDPEKRVAKFGMKLDANVNETAGADPHLPSHAIDNMIKLLKLQTEKLERLKLETEGLERGTDYHPAFEMPEASFQQDEEAGSQGSIMTKLEWPLDDLSDELFLCDGAGEGQQHSESPGKRQRSSEV